MGYLSIKEKQECAQPKFGTSAGALANSFAFAIDKMNNWTHQYVQFGEGYLASEYDVVSEVEQLLAEPNYDEGLTDIMLCFNLEHPSKRSSLDNFKGSISSINYSDVIADTGALVFGTAREDKEKARIEYIDGVSLEDAKNLYVSNDYIGPCVGDHLGKLDLVNQSEDPIERDKVSTEMSDLAGIIPLPESEQRRFMLEKMTVHELQEAHRTIFGKNTLFANTTGATPAKTISLAARIKSGSSTLGDSGAPGAFIPEKRTRKYIEESPNLKCDGRLGVPPRVKITRNRSHCWHDPCKMNGETFLLARERLLGNSDIQVPSGHQKQKGHPTEKTSIKEKSQCGNEVNNNRSHSRLDLRKLYGEVFLLSREKAIGSSDLQVPFGFQKQNGHPKKRRSIRGGDSRSNRLPSVISGRKSFSELSAFELSKNALKETLSVKEAERGGNKKRIRKPWKPLEVIKLINGVAKYGVGRWTDLKKGLFASSDHRSPTDLKDKWRNLLKANSSESQNTRAASQFRRRRPLPDPFHDVFVHRL